jgi:hypothetical protein
MRQLPFVIRYLVLPPCAVVCLAVASSIIVSRSAFAQTEDAGQAEDADESASSSEPQASPGPTPAAKPVKPALPAKAEKKEPTRDEREVQWHDKTPVSLANRMFLGASLGIGAGMGPGKGYSSDRLAGQVFAQYLLISPTGGIRWILEGQYASHTGVDVDVDESLSTQAFLAGGGVDFPLGVHTEPIDTKVTPLGSRERMRLQASALLGLTKAMRHSLETGARPTSKYGAGAGLELRYLHLLHPHIEGVVGLGARGFGYAWFSANIGVLGSL